MLGNAFENFIKKDNRGISLLYILGIMMFLLAIGTSVLAASGANMGFLARQRVHNQAVLLDDSVHRNIMYSLQFDTADPSLLAEQLFWLMYFEEDEDARPEDFVQGAINLNNMQPTINFSNGTNITAEEANVRLTRITLSITELNVIITDSRPAIWEIIALEDGEIYIPQVGDEDFIDVDGEPAIRRLERAREPRTADVDALLEVTVEISANGRMIASRAFYSYEG
ncbi:MAG: hypothetical protein FWC09_10805, partial [Lachnospiraceae bacterium]|nr:hypothetical protein [Lachnospiraceae bacterium]